MSRLLLLALPSLVACSSSPCAEFGVALQEGATNHVASCASSTCGNGEDPPAAGPHCGEVAACRVHASAVSRCRWLHNLEHGHVVLAYNCPDGCPDIVDALSSIHAETTLPKRVIVTSDPQLTRRVAAIVWGLAWSGDTMDADAIRCVMSQQDSLAPEAYLSCPQ